MLTRKWLMGCLKAQGYNGPETEAEVSKFIGDAKITDEDNNTVDWKAAWSNNVLTFDVPKAPNADERLAKRRAEADTAKVDKANKVDAAEDAETKGTKFQTPKAYGRMMARKQYAAKAALGKTVWGDADLAEAMGANLRYASATVNGIDYPEKNNDAEIVKSCPMVTKNSTTNINATAGFLVDPQYVSGILYATEFYGAARKLANIVTLTSDNAMVKRKTAIPSMTFTAETGTLTEGDPSYGLVELTARKAGVICRYSNELLDDASVNIADEVSKSVGEAQAKLEDQMYFIGDGTSTYGNVDGLVQALPSAAYVAQATSNTWAAQVAADIDSVLGVIENVELARIKMSCSRQYFFQVLHRLAQAAGGATGAERMYGIGGNVATGEFFYYGIPVVLNQVTPTATGTSARSLYVGDFEGGTMIGDRKQLTITRSDEAYFTSDQVAFRAISRIAMAIHGDGRVPTSTYGPIACLKNS